MSISLEDREEIRELVARYDFALDLGDFDGVVATFAPDGVFWADGFGEGSSVGGRHQGREALFKFAKLNFEGYHAHLRHWNNGVQIIEGDGNHARMRSYIMGVTVGMLGQAHILETGIYYDRLCKLDGQWLFEERHFIADPQFEHRELKWEPENSTRKSSEAATSDPSGPESS